MKKIIPFLAISAMSVSAFFLASSFNTVDPPPGGDVKCRHTNVASDYCDDGNGNSKYYCVNSKGESNCKFNEPAAK